MRLRSKAQKDRQQNWWPTVVPYNAQRLRPLARDRYDGVPPATFRLPADNTKLGASDVVRRVGDRVRRPELAAARVLHWLPQPDELGGSWLVEKIDFQLADIFL